MLVCRLVLICIIFTITAVTTFKSDLSKVNIDLKTYVDIDEKDTDADIRFLFKNKEMTGDVKIMIDEDSHLHRKFRGRNDLTFTDFIYSMINVIKMFNDNDLEYFCAIFDDEIRKYHYQGCKFYELTENPALRKFIASKLEIIRQKPPNTIRKHLSAIADDIEKYNFDDSKRELVNLVNSLYKKDSIKKLKNVLNDMETYGANSIKNTNLVKIIRKGMRSILFDHYTALHKIIREELTHKMEEYLNNNLKSSTVILAELTNAMVLDLHPKAAVEVRGLDNTFTINNKINRNPNYVTMPNMRYRRLTTKRKKKLSANNKVMKNAGIDETTSKFQPVLHKKPLRFVYIKNKKQKSINNTMKTTTQGKNMITMPTKTYTKIITINQEKKFDIELPDTNSKTYDNEEVTTSYSKLTTFSKAPKSEIPKQQTHIPLKDKVQTLWYIIENLLSTNPSTPEKGFIDIVTMKPYSPRNITSFGKFHYIVDLVKDDESQTKIPGIVFNKPMEILGVRTVGIGEATTKAVNYKKDMPILRREVQKEKNIIFYRRTINQTIGNNKEKLSRFQQITPETQSIEVTSNLYNKFVDYKRSKEPYSIKTVQNKSQVHKKENVIINLRINVDDYIKKMNITPSRFKKNSRKRLETNKVSKNQYTAKPFFRGEEYNYDDFIRGKNNNGHQDKKVGNFISRTTTKDPFIKGLAFNYGESSRNLKIDNLDSHKETYKNEPSNYIDKYTKSYFNNYTDEKRPYDEYYDQKNVVIRNVKPHEDEILTKSNKLISYDTDTEKPKSHSSNVLKDTEQRYNRSYNNSKKKDNSNVESGSLENNKKIKYKFNAGAEKIEDERKQQSASNEEIKASESKKYDQQQNIYPETEVKEKQTNNEFYINKEIKNDYSTNEPYIETVTKFRQASENGLNYVTHNTKVQLNYIVSRSISKEDIDLNKPKNDLIHKPKSRFRIQSRNNNNDLLNTNRINKLDVNQAQTNFNTNMIKKDQIFPLNGDGNLTNEINRRNYMRSRSRNLDENTKSEIQRLNIDNKTKDERYIPEAEGTKSPINDQDILFKDDSNEKEQNIYEHDKTSVAESTSEKIQLTENPIDFLNQTTSESSHQYHSYHPADDQIVIGTVTSFDLSKEITAPNLDNIEPLLKTLEERDELAELLDNKAKRRMNLLKPIKDSPADTQLVNEDLNLTSIYSEEEINDQDVLMAPPPTLPNNFE